MQLMITGNSTCSSKQILQFVIKYANILMNNNNKKNS